MGYDLTRFTETINVDFRCPICRNVLENAVESQHCQHVFCNECIKKWLINNNICPVDKKSLKYNYIRPINLILRNLLSKLKIKCEYQKHGCSTVIAVDNLKIHVENCAFNPIPKVRCDRGCGLMVSPKEQKNHNCIASLSRSIIKLYEDNLLLKEKIREIQNKQYWICTKELFVNNSNTIVCCENNIGIAQSRFCLSHFNYHFEVKIVDFGEETMASVGLTIKSLYNVVDQQFDELNYLVFLNCDGILRSYSYFPVVSDRIDENTGTKWEIGDIIECGVNFQKSMFEIKNDFVVVVVYFKHNNVLICEKSLKLKDGTLFPTVCLKNNGAKLIVIS